MIPILLSFAYKGYQGYQDTKNIEEMKESTDEINKQVNENNDMLTDLTTIVDEQSFTLGAIQTSMSVLGATSIASLSLSAFSLYKINEISKDIKNLSSQINNGFIDMKYFISEEITQLINHQQEVKLSEAYEYYQKALQNFQRSLSINDKELKKHSFFNSIQQLDKSLVIYDSQKQFQELSPAGELRRLETIMIIESIKAEIYMIMGERDAGKEHYIDLLNRANKELKYIGNNACKNTIDLILSDTLILKNNDLKLIDYKLAV